MSAVQAISESAERPALQGRSRESRDRLVKAGLRAFARDGYEGARIADIAAEARISIGSFYHRFGDKRGFFNVLAAEFVSRSERNWDRFFESVEPTCSADELFRRIIAGTARTMRRNIGFFHALLSLGRADPTISPNVQRIDAYAAEKLHQCLRERRMLDGSEIGRERLHFIINTIGKKLAFSFAIEGPACTADSPENVAELSLMARCYLGIEAQGGQRRQGMNEARRGGGHD
jgi:AcrR family transcriptional regulator